MSTAPATGRLARYALQAAGYALFCAFLGYFSTSPPYRHLAPGDALVKVSLTHAGARKEPCHERTPEELAKLAPNMRAASVCPRERVPVEVEVDVDGARLISTIAPPSGFARDGASTVYHRATLPAGTHHVVARLKDSPGAAFTHVREADVILKPGGLLVLDFDPREGWVFRT